MCGRYNVIPNAGAFLEAFEITMGLDRLPSNPAYNISPSAKNRITHVPIVRMRDDQRELAMVRWPLIPPWAKGQPVGYSTANAKCETLDQKPSYKNAWRNRRCLVPASGYYEWQTVPQRRNKQPYHIRTKDQQLFAFGGLWEQSKTEQGEIIESCTIVTTPTNRTLQAIHPRMPLMLLKEGYVDWLTGTTQDAERWLKPFPAELMEAYPVSTYVNNPTHNDSRCIEPIDVPVYEPDVNSARQEQ